MIRKSDIFILLAALISLGLSASLFFVGQTNEALFTGLWVPSILGFGAFFKLMAQRTPGR
jgi:hypothetical protein